MHHILLIFENHSRLALVHGMCGWYRMKVFGISQVDSTLPEHDTTVSLTARLLTLAPNYNRGVAVFTRAPNGLSSFGSSTSVLGGGLKSHRLLAVQALLPLLINAICIIDGSRCCASMQKLRRACIIAWRHGMHIHLLHIADCLLSGVGR